MPGAMSRWCGLGAADGRCDRAVPLPVVTEHDALLHGINQYLLTQIQNGKLPPAERRLPAAAEELTPCSARRELLDDFLDFVGRTSIRARGTPPSDC